MYEYIVTRNPKVDCNSHWSEVWSVQTQKSWLKEIYILSQSQEHAPSVLSIVIWYIKLIKMTRHFGLQMLWHTSISSTASLVTVTFHSSYPYDESKNSDSVLTEPDGIDVLIVYLLGVHWLWIYQRVPTMAKSLSTCALLAVCLSAITKQRGGSVASLSRCIEMDFFNWLQICLTELTEGLQIMNKLNRLNSFSCRELLTFTHVGVQCYGYQEKE